MIQAFADLLAAQAMLVVGVVLLAAFTLWEVKYTAYPLMPRRIWNRTFICCVVIDIIYVRTDRRDARRPQELLTTFAPTAQYLSAYLRDTYFASWVYVIKDWSLRDYTYYSNIPTVGLCTFGVVAGILFRLTRSYKWTQVFGLVVRTLGLGLTVNSASSDAKLVVTQVLVSVRSPSFLSVGTFVTNLVRNRWEELSLSSARKSHRKPLFRTPWVQPSDQNLAFR